MISRIEFYTCIVILCSLVAFSYLPQPNADEEVQKALLRMQDSILQEQQDWKLNAALKFELAADSMQAVINRKDLDFTLIQKKYEKEKNNVLLLNADSTLSFFERSVIR